MERARFFYDFGSPYGHLAAERVEKVVGPVEWCPVFLVGIFKAGGRRSWVYTDGAPAEWAEVERRLRDRGLPPLALCDGWAEKLVPGATPARSTLLAQRVARVAVEHDLARAFTLALYRETFQRAGDLTDPETVLGVAAAAGVPRDAAAAAIEDPRRKEQVRSATDEAVSAGVTGVPTILIGEKRFWGDDRLEDAAAAF
ncbi:MAG: DsbA family protein [Solirubrobacteraceae bacterium]|nr:DsbA family protein [Solirubrobacteraceae bacterium]